MVDLIRTAVQSGARLPRACDEAGLSLRTWRRWVRDGQVQSDQRPLVPRPAPQNKLTQTERQAILGICNEVRYAHQPPPQIVADLLDQGVWLASESSFYRILKENDQLHHRGRSQAPRKTSLPTSYTATAANQVWSWDITYLPSVIRGHFYYLYLFEDIFSRKIVGYEVHEQECGVQAAELVQRCLLREQCFRRPLVLHSDNGAPMKSQTLKAKLEELGIASSYSRPRVSNDNPFSEALFRTLKYRPQWPSSGFKELQDAREWVERFVHWYNHEHRHSKLNFVTPAERHAGKDRDVLEQRKAILEAAKAANPQRWSKGVRNCEPAGPVDLNPEKEKTADRNEAA